MPKRSYSGAGAYRYGFNGKENDNEVKGLGNQQDYGMRVYDPRIGKFLSIDPITKHYPGLTPYQFASNRPIDGIDLDGLEWYKTVGKYILYSISPASTLITTKDGREILQGAAERADKTIVQPIKDFINRENTNNGTTLGRTTFSDPNIAKKNLMQEYELKKSLAEGVFETLKDYKDLVQDAFSGDKKAMGGVAFEAVLLLLPFDEIRFGRGAVLKAANTTIQTTGRNLKFGIVNDAIKFEAKGFGEGFYDFVIMENGELRLGEGHYYLSNSSETVRSAGQVFITKEGKIQTVTNNSGHYVPDVENSIDAAKVFKENKIAAKGIDVVNVKKK